MKVKTYISIVLIGEVIAYVSSLILSFVLLISGVTYLAHAESSGNGVYASTARTWFLFSVLGFMISGLIALALGEIISSHKEIELFVNHNLFENEPNDYNFLETLSYNTYKKIRELYRKYKYYREKLLQTKTLTEKFRAEKELFQELQKEETNLENKITNIKKEMKQTLLQDLIKSIIT